MVVRHPLLLEMLRAGRDAGRLHLDELSADAVRVIDDTLGEGEVAIVIGEAGDESVCPRHAPAARERRRPAGETRGEAGRDGAHGWGLR